PCPWLHTHHVPPTPHPGRGQEVRPRGRAEWEEGGILLRARKGRPRLGPPRRLASLAPGRHLATKNHTPVFGCTATPLVYQITPRKVNRSHSRTGALQTRRLVAILAGVVVAGNPVELDTA